MKTYYPKNINPSWLNLHFSIGPFSISLVQMVIVAVGVVLSLALRNNLVKGGTDKFFAAILISPIVLTFGTIAFFEISELPLVPFIAKIIQTYILDEPIKHQLMIHKDDPVEIHLKQLSKLEPEQKIASPKTTIDLDKWSQIEQKDIL